MSSKVRNIFRINRKSLFATLGGFETPGALFFGYTWIWSTVNVVNFHFFFKQVCFLIFTRSYLSSWIQYKHHETKHIKVGSDFPAVKWKHLKCDFIIMVCPRLPTVIFSRITSSFKGSANVVRQQVAQIPLNLPPNQKETHTNHSTSPWFDSQIYYVGEESLQIWNLSRCIW